MMVLPLYDALRPMPVRLLSLLRRSIEVFGSLPPNGKLFHLCPESKGNNVLGNMLPEV
jgi:hypothetical protein